MARSSRWASCGARGTSATGWRIRGAVEAEGDLSRAAITSIQAQRDGVGVDHVPFIDQIVRERAF